MVDKSFIGKTYPPFIVPVEKGRIRLFAKAIGDDNPIFVDETAARVAGYRTIPAPPTFAFAAAMDGDQMFGVLRDMGLSVPRTLHGEQWFTFRAPVYAGDVLTGQQTITDAYEKKGGALQFVVSKIRLRNQFGDPVCEMKTVVVVRN